MMLGRPDASTDVSSHGNTMLVITISLRSLHGSGGALLSVFPLVLAKSLSPALGSPVKDVLAVLVHLELDNDDLAWVDSNVDGGAIGLLPLDPLNVDSELFPVALDNLAHLLTLVVASDDLHFIVLPDRHGPDSVLGPQLLGEGSGHEAPPDVGGGREVPFPRLGPVRGDVLIQFHLLL